MSLSLNRVINVEDFAETNVRRAIREVFAHEVERCPDFPTGREHRKHWEVAMAVLALREGGALVPEAEILGIGAGHEATLFWLTNHVRRVWATDLYADPGEWAPDASPAMLTDPGRYWPGSWNPARLVVQHVDALNLTYEDETFDGIFSSGSIEHFGGLDQVRRAMAEAYRVLKPGGVLSLSTEYLLEGDPLLAEDKTIMFTAELIGEVLLADCDWELLSPPDYSVSRATYETEVPVDAMLDAHDRAAAEDGAIQLEQVELEHYPHAVLRVGPNAFTSVHLALRRPGRVSTTESSRTPAPASHARASAPRDGVAGLSRHLPDPVVVVDAGCRWGFSEHWTNLQPDVRLIGFDPDAEECRRLEERYDGQLDATLVPLALGSGPERRRLHRFRFSAANSFHPHDQRALMHAAIPRDGDVLEEMVDVEVETLDRWCAEHDVARVDALKLDVQGHEIEVLRGAADRLADVRAVELEVCLNPIMSGTPLFGEVDAFLRERGFYLWRLRDLQHYPVKDAEGAAGSVETADHFGYGAVSWTAPPGFVSWGNAHYVRAEAFDAEARLPWAVRLRDAVLMNALRFHDLAVVALRRALEASPPADVAEAIRIALAGATASRTDEHVTLPEAEAALPSPVHETQAPPAARVVHSRSPFRWKVRNIAKRPYWPLLWRLERNHQHAQWRADAHDQRMNEIRDRLERLEASMSALGGRLAIPSSPSRLEDDVRRMVQELWEMHHMSNEAILEWTALFGRALETSGDPFGNGART